MEMPRRLDGPPVAGANKGQWANHLETMGRKAVAVRNIRGLKRHVRHASPAAE